MEIKKWTDESASGVGGCPYGNMNNAIVIPFYHLCIEYYSFGVFLLKTLKSKEKIEYYSVNKKVGVFLLKTLKRILEKFNIE
jgi:hypothetical protein